jgi:predicted transcriptional regulator
MQWNHIIQELINSGLNQHQIAKECNCSQTAISLLYTGKRTNTKFDTGKALMDLHTKITQTN